MHGADGQNDCLRERLVLPVDCARPQQKTAILAALRANDRLIRPHLQIELLDDCP